MARSSRKKNKKDVLIKAVAIGSALVAVLLALHLLHSNSSTTDAESTADINTSQAASAYVGNKGTFVGQVEDIRTVNNNRVVCILLKGSEKKYVPLLIPEGTEANIYRNKTYSFKYECRSSKDGKVKGVFIVTEVQSQS